MMYPMKIVVIYESRTGNTARAAKIIGSELTARGHEVGVFPTKKVDLAWVSDADLAIVGTWVDGAILFGHRPGGEGNIFSFMPTIWDKPTFSFMTYAVRAGGALGKFNTLLESKGANVLGGLELHRKRLESEALTFADEVLANLPKELSKS